MFSEVLEVLAAWSTSANDSEQRKDRPRFKPALMAKPPRVTTVLVDATVAFANVPGVRVEKCVWPEHVSEPAPPGAITTLEGRGERPSSSPLAFVFCEWRRMAPS